MLDVEDVLDDLFTPGSGARPTTRTRSLTRTGPGSYDLDYADPDVLFIVSIQPVRRQHLLARPVTIIAPLAGHETRIVIDDVVIDTAVRLHLRIDPSPADEQRLLEFDAAVQRWMALPTHEKDAMPFPADPAAVLMGLPVALSDEHETPYTAVGGHHGGSGSEWLAQRVFSPVPPAGVSVLNIVVGAAEGSTVVVAVAPRTD